MKSSILITNSKYVAITPNPLQKIPPATITSPGLLALDDMSKPEIEISPVRGKKRRLDHLTWEEKMQRKKLKNRVAAQTSRDRKKAKMDQMEQTITDLTERAEILQNKCTTLEAINNSLMTKNQKLDVQVQELDRQLKFLQQQMKEEKFNISASCDEMKSDCIDSDSNNSNRSAESITYPLPKGTVPESMLFGYTKQQGKDYYKGKAVTPLLKIIMLCLLYKICSKTSTSTNLKISTLKNLPNFYSQMSQKSWKKIIERAAMLMPKVQAKQSNCLDEWWGPHQNAWSNRPEQSLKRDSDSLTGTGNICIKKHQQNSNKKNRSSEIKENKIEKLIVKSDKADLSSISEPETLYGTYDERTHSITICLQDGSDPIEEIVEEVGSEQENTENMEIPITDCTNVGSNGQSLMFSSSATSMEEDLDYDPIKEFLTIPTFDKRPKSPFSVISDHGYGSIGSPENTSGEIMDKFQFDELWNDSFTDLFPSLL
ncbi:LOW QUALITY PROTEIN: uncharacterized protein LOC129606217 [Condylostylus longicornis]|uniref:LOW QUALITY PROTEIN: uncharacterized protein LOC129606217 n=1 Tax=Condylostylus longicornis TaxID=2530218 RepID=UPI00244DB184|nr:LOW QUALITY PROTEIN: uncharacterized protein LOC129606217 [Condylostylus longicornis]